MTTNNRLTLEDINSLILWEDFHTFDETCMTVCCITLKNGYTVTGTSSCINPENFNVEVAKDVSFSKARAKIFELEGYLTKECMYQDALDKAEVMQHKFDNEDKPNEDPWTGADITIVQYISVPNAVNCDYNKAWEEFRAEGA